MNQYSNQSESKIQQHCGTVLFFFFGIMCFSHYIALVLFAFLCLQNCILAQNCEPCSGKIQVYADDVLHFVGGTSLFFSFTEVSHGILVIQIMGFSLHAYYCITCALLFH